MTPARSQIRPVDVTGGGRGPASLPGRKAVLIVGALALTVGGASPAIAGVTDAARNARDAQNAQVLRVDPVQPLNADSRPTFIDHFAVDTDSGPLFITAGPDRNLWFTEFAGRKVGRMALGGRVTEFPTTGILPASSGAGGITVGPDGNVWFTLGGQGPSYFGSAIGRVTPAGQVTVFPLASARGPQAVTGGPDGNVWFTEFNGHKIGRITPAGKITEFSLPTVNARPHEITRGPDGNLWFSEPNENQVARITTDGVVTEFPLPAPFRRPAAITAGPDGNIWFTQRAIGHIGRITPAGQFTDFPLPVDRGAGDIGEIGADHDAVWFTEQKSDCIGRITPDGLVGEFADTPAKSNPGSNLTTGPDGNLWFVEWMYQSPSDTIARLNPRPPAGVRRPCPPPNPGS